ncbi:MAG TPA: HlyD family efflux transporter periplasmic adaptor subunit [Chloroflexi bacterium]|nr:HlyD family efflux transporter periplasmic adaptor subunit [Chloroflexota bacterium]
MQRIANSEWRMIRLIAGGLALVLLLLGCASETANGTITASGFIEGKEVTIASQVSGRIAEMRVNRGDEVRAGDVLVQLDDAVLQSQRLEVESGVAAAEANLARVLAGARPEEVAVARAALSQAEARLEGAKQAVVNARDVISKPLTLETEIAAARTQVKLAEQDVEMAEANLAETRLKWNVYQDQGGDVKRTWDLQVRAAEAALQRAQANLNGARRYLGALIEMRDNPLRLQTELHGAETQARLARAQVGVAQASLDEMEAGATAEEIAVTEARLHQAKAALRLIDAQIDHLTLEAPMDGTVTSRVSKAGETATAGMPLVTIANLDEVELVIYIPVTQIGRVKLGQAVEVEVDSFPDRVFIGEIVNIAGEAEFTPRNVQTQEERVNLVFAVKVRLSNEDHALKPGMPADATVLIDR